MKRRGWLVFTVVVLSVLSAGGMGYTATQVQAGVASQQEFIRMNNGIMDTGGMMGTGGRMGYTNAYAHLNSRAQLTQLIRQGENGAVLNRHTNTITYSEKSIHLVALASPDEIKNMAWEIDGLVNPTVIIPPYASVQFTLVNTDWGYRHGLEVTSTSPPYSYMSMMNVNSNFLLMPLSERTTKSLSTAKYYTQSGQLHLNAGTYYYLCPIPGHAQQGMYGTLKVK